MERTFGTIDKNRGTTGWEELGPQETWNIWYFHWRGMQNINALHMFCVNLSLAFKRIFFFSKTIKRAPDNMANVRKHWLINAKGQRWILLMSFKKIAFITIVIQYQHWQYMILIDHEFIYTHQGQYHIGQCWRAFRLELALPVVLKLQIHFK